MELTEAREKQVSCILYVESKGKKKKTHKWSYFKIERDSQTYEDKHMIIKGEKVGQGEE